MNDLDHLNSMLPDDKPHGGVAVDSWPHNRPYGTLPPEKKRKRRPRKLSASQRKRALDDLKKLRGLPPYDGGGNICCGDGYFAVSLVHKYGMEIQDLEIACGFRELKAKWDRARAEFS